MMAALVFQLFSHEACESRSGVCLGMDTPQILLAHALECGMCVSRTHALWTISPALKMRGPSLIFCSRSPNNIQYIAFSLLITLLCAEYFESSAEKSIKSPNVFFFTVLNLYVFVLNMWKFLWSVNKTIELQASWLTVKENKLSIENLVSSRNLLHYASDNLNII